MCTSIWRRVTLALPLALLAAGWDGDCRVWAQSSESNIGVSKVSGENDASLFDSRLLNTAATSNGACIASPPSGGRCIESPTQAPNLINPDAVFSPDQPSAQAPAPAMSNSPALNPQASNAQSFGSLSAGQGALTAQNNVPAFMGDYFGGAGSTIVGGGGGSGGLNGATVSIPSSTAVGIMRASYW